MHHPLVAVEDIFRKKSPEMWFVTQVNMCFLHVFISSVLNSAFLLGGGGWIEDPVGMPL